MNEALDAMVKAMKAELGDRLLVEYKNGHVLIDGDVDLEKVARAGLVAIREPRGDIAAAAEAADRSVDPFIGTDAEGVPADPADAETYWRFMIDKILEKKP